jgi:hypothetical protein
LKVSIKHPSPFERVGWLIGDKRQAEVGLWLVVLRSQSRKSGILHKVPFLN